MRCSSMNMSSITMTGQMMSWFLAPDQRSRSQSPLQMTVRLSTMPFRCYTRSHICSRWLWIGISVLAQGSDIQKSIAGV